ncbi:hypothetical protein [Microbacterium soli]|uniref:Uncharacterized protein n=1 Tax=Microbacterium soli TaxID=446075 RepID=A0ABP7MPM3_9MICO
MSAGFGVNGDQLPLPSVCCAVPDGVAAGEIAADAAAFPLKISAPVMKMAEAVWPNRNAKRRVELRM